jgi:hypothetical protein
MKKFLYTVFVALFITAPILAQRPSLQPNSDGEPVDFTEPKNIFIFVVLPTVIVILYLLYRREQKKDQWRNK